MKLVYIAGPFRAASAWGIEQNVRRAEAMGLEVAGLGAMPVIPHANTRFFHGLLTDGFWLEGTLALLRRCDALMLVEGWEGSTGTRAELAESMALGLPSFSSIEDLRSWLAGPPAAEVPASRCGAFAPGLGWCLRHANHGGNHVWRAENGEGSGG